MGPESARSPEIECAGTRLWAGSGEHESPARPREVFDEFPLFSHALRNIPSLTDRTASKANRVIVEYGLLSRRHTRIRRLQVHSQRAVACFDAAVG